MPEQRAWMHFLIFLREQGLAGGGGGGGEGARGGGGAAGGGGGGEGVQRRRREERWNAGKRCGISNDSEYLRPLFKKSLC